MAKKWYASKTLWFNVLALVLAVAGGFGFGQFDVADWVPGVATALVTVINLVLRIWFTDTKIEK